MCEEDFTESLSPDFFDSMQQGEEYRLLSNVTEVEIIPSVGQDGTCYFRTSGRKAHFQGPGVDLRKLNLARRQRRGVEIIILCVFWIEK